MSVFRRLLLLVGAIQLLAALPAAADFRVCHDADQDVMAAVSYYDQRQQGWYIAGWFAIEPRSCHTLTTGDVRGQQFYVYAEISGTSVRWTGDTQLCVERPNAFRIQNHGQSCAETQKFSEVQSGQHSDYSYTLNINVESRRALAPTFNCSNVRQAAEKAICRHPQLAELDREMAARFSRDLAELSADSDKEAFRSAQRKFIEQRNQCSADASCITSRIRERLAAIESERNMRGEAARATRDRVAEERALNERVTRDAAIQKRQREGPPVAQQKSVVEVKAQMGHAQGVTTVAFSPDGRSVLSGSADGALKLWDVVSGRELRSFSGHRGAAMSAVFSRDGRTFLSGGGDSTLKLWDVASGSELRTFTGVGSFVESVAFSPDG